jgi:uncharacterized integral membrane protein (TIGR00697 family)
MKSYLIVLLLVFIVLSSSYSHKHSSSLSSLSSSLHQYKYNNKNKLVTLYNSINDNGNGSDIIALSNKKSNTNPNLPPYTLNIQQKVYLFLTSLFVSCLIVADVIGVKIFEIKLPFTILGHKSIEHTCGMLTFPITFLLGDLINEYYGPKATKQTVYIGLIMSVMVFTVMNIAQVLPYLNKPFNVTPEAFNMIFGSAKLMYVASIAAYLVGQLLDIWLFGVIKKITKGEYLWVRATGSTLISQLIDSFVVSYIAFGFGKRVTGQVPATLREVWNIACTGYALKFVIAALITPILYALRDIMHKKFKLEPVPLDYVE